MPHLTRRSPSPATDFDIPVATSDPSPPPTLNSPRRSLRLRASSPRSPNARQPVRVPTPQAPSRRRNVAATTPARPPVDKGKAVNRRHRAISEDPNLPPFRHPSYIFNEPDELPSLPEHLIVSPSQVERRVFAPLAEDESSSPPRRAVFRPLPAASHSWSSSEDSEEDELEAEYERELPFEAANGVIIDYPPPEHAGEDWLKKIVDVIEDDLPIKDLLQYCKKQIKDRLYESTIASMELNDLWKDYERMLKDIRKEMGDPFVDNLLAEAQKLNVPGYQEEGIVHRRPTPPPTPPPHPSTPPQRIPALTATISGVSRNPRANVSLPGPRSNPAEPARHSSSPPSSPSNIASRRAQKRKLDAPQDIFIDFSKRPRRTGLPSRTTFHYSPLPPSSPIRTERSTSLEPSSSGMPQEGVLAPAAVIGLPPAREAREESDPDCVHNDSNAENFDSAGNAVDLVKGKAVASNGQESDEEEHEAGEVRMPLQDMMTPLSVHYTYPEPADIRQRSSEFDISLHWPEDEPGPEEKFEGAYEGIDQMQTASTVLVHRRRRSLGIFLGGQRPSPGAGARLGGPHPGARPQGPLGWTEDRSDVFS